MLFQQRQYRFLRPPVQDAVLAHDADNLGAGDIFADYIRTNGGDAIIPDEAFLLQFLKGFNRLVDRIFESSSVQLVQIYIIGLQSAQTLLYCRLDIGFGRVPAPAFLSGDSAVAHFGGKNDIRAAPAQRLADNFFIPPFIIEVGSIQEVDAQLQCLMNDRGSLRFICPEGHAAESHGAYI
ncbi:hypothetical protein D3C73_1125900 [compost metagenome]